MPSSLPDPVLALSLASVQKLNNVDLDQLANLWNVFTKCKESLESGRRLENLSWRLWFREAHLLPPDTSLSDLADFTPLDTPLTSRRGSITGSLPSSRPINATTYPSLVSVDGQLAALNDAPLSDPESADWSDDDDENQPAKQVESRGRTPTRTEAGLPESEPFTKEEPANIVAPVKTINRDSSTSKAATTTTTMAEASVSTSHADGLTSGGLLGGLLDRKRAVSSSSAFGSRARVKQHNTARRRRPLSFQQAIESLLDRSKDFRQHDVGGAPCSSSLREGTADVGIDTNGNKWRSEGLVSGLDAVAIGMQQNSAPAEFNQVDAAPSVQIISPVISPAPADVTNRLEEDRRSMPPPVGVPSQAKDVLRREEADAGDQAKESKFFMAGQSVDDSASSVSGSLAPSQYSPKQQRRREKSPASRPAASRRAPSEAASDQSQRQQASQRGQQQQQHPHPHHQGHGKLSSHGMTAGGRNRSAVNLSRAPAVAKGKGAGRVASGGSTGSSKRGDGQGESREVQRGARVPVKFSLSGGEDDDDDFTDDDSEEGKKPSGGHLSQKGSALQKTDGKQGDGDDEDDEWSSASSTDSEELQRRVLARRKQEEVERQQSMFQKKPIKSASTADVRNVARRSSAPIEGSSSRDPPPDSPVQPVRGLLSSLFHPEEGPHPPPGQLAGRPHASAADLRMKPSRQADSRPRTQEFKMTALPSTTQVPSIGGGALKLSKSAVALPVLSTLGSRSEAKRGHEAKGSRDSAVFDDDESAEDSEGGSEYGTSQALARLNQLAYQKKEMQREGKRQSKSRQATNKSLNVEVAPELDEETIMAIRRREAGATPVLAGSRPGSQVPETSMPQTPRTTRRNMLRDELSESLRQSLLWERQSRNRMLGIGALDSNPRNQGNQSAAGDNRSRSMNRNQTVLGGGQLRPLTSSSSVTNMGEQQPRQRPQRRQQQMHQTEEASSNSNANTAHRSYTGDFHHAGW